MTRKDVLREIAASEKDGIFDRHIDPIPEDLILPVDATYVYPTDRGFFQTLKYGMEKLFLVKPFTLYENKCVLHTKVEGREHLKHLQAAVLTCNHVAKFDCLAVKYGARGHRVYTVAAHFNNMKGFLGEMMRAGDMLPLNTTLKGTGHFNRAVETVLTERKQFLLIYPEASMWWHYKKVRPFKDGGFRIAAKYKVPVVPQFITYRDSGKKDEENLPIFDFTLHIGEPVYPKETGHLRENAAYLRDAAFAFCQSVYEKTYGKPLVYDGDIQ